MSSQIHTNLIDSPALDHQLGAQVQQRLIQFNPNTADPEMLSGEIRKLLRVLLEHIATNEPLHFSTLFSLMAYIGHKYKTPGGTLRALHLFRKASEQLDKEKEPDPSQYMKVIALGYRAIEGLLNHVFLVPTSPAFASILEDLPAINAQEQTYQRFESIVVFYATSIQLTDWLLIGYREEEPLITLTVQGNVAEKNEDFNGLWKSLAHLDHLPVKLHLLDVEFDAEGIAYPRGFILHPDHLVDVTAIAECFTPTSAFPVLSILKKFLPSEQTKSILIGNVANYFLDRLMQDPGLTFEDAFQGVFALNPMGFALLDDQEVRDLHLTCRQHFITLSQIVQFGFAKEGIRLQDCFLEPSFYSPEFGIQGRLDVLHLPPASTSTPAIIELKSGAPFRSNAYGLNANHYIQTLLYDLLVKDVRPGRQALTYILYSKVTENPLRFAPVIRSRQMDALRVRNELILLEQELAQMDPSLPDTWMLLNNLTPDGFPGLYGFHSRDIILFSRVWQGLNDREKAYFVAFTSFALKEFHQSKTGRAGSGRQDGQAALWLATRAEKTDQFSVLTFLQLEEDNSHESEPEIQFRFTDRTPALANFRIGDITVLYPHTGRVGFTKEQVWKCTITQLGSDAVSVRLRSPQFNKEQFLKYPFWHLESDFLDSSFVQLTKSLFQFAQAPSEKRNLILGLKKPEEPAQTILNLPDILTVEQQNVIQSLVQSKDYYLLWGPPGTGKTSMVLKHLIGYLFEQTDETFLLLAYTNRAVDEICMAIEALGPLYHERYLRIGSRFSTQEIFRDRLLDSVIREYKDRNGVQQVIRETRIIVGTISSFLGKPELLTLKKFDRVLIDEASQILEPMLCGLLARFSHFTLIGDHRQLPAVVTQPIHERQIKVPLLQEVGITDAGHSLFERLYHRVCYEGWSHAYGMLSAQGRMHQDIMAFPNEHFYEGHLKIITPIQAAPSNDPDLDHVLHDQMKNRRVAFIPVVPDENERLSKTNLAEANKLFELVRYYQELYVLMGKSWDIQTLGIITPFRAQIALIKKIFAEKGLGTDLFTIDTVERYQGGAREIILISWCIQTSGELHMITSGEPGLDRKLNVALTRAKERLICLGYPPAFEGHSEYEDFIQRYTIPATECP
ncbi:MAG: AAA family ATPase [Saprospiraceae bacterium]|nr:AAA family ATPase [Saprospiraceae bacterium]